MLTVVFDTVIFLRALINPHGIWGRMVFRHAGRYRLIMPEPIRYEIIEVLSRPELTRKFRTLAGMDRTAILSLLDRAENVDVIEIAPIS